jgi:1,4-dihydroxy-6-naphthoate synthase
MIRRVAYFLKKQNPPRGTCSVHIFSFLGLSQSESLMAFSQKKIKSRREKTIHPTIQPSIKFRLNLRLCESPEKNKKSRHHKSRHHSMTLTLGFSPCPNDTFIFDALLHGKIDTEGLDFQAVIEDVEALNRRAFAHQLDITKLSYHAFAHLTEAYALLSAGSALGRGCGPLLVAREPLSDAQIEAARIAIPGRMTTANFLLGIAYPAAQQRIETLFSDIEDAVLRQEAEAGLIIHENRFTYAQRGLVKLLDLGEYWENTTGLPIPLGGIVVRRDVPLDVQQTIERVLRRSVEYAFAQPESVMPFVRQHAQAMDERVMQAHIELYVNEYSIDLGTDGQAAVQQMFELADAKGWLPTWRRDFWVA